MIIILHVIKKEWASVYQFFTLHALHQSLKEMDGIALAEVEGFLDGCDDVSLHTIRKAAVEQLQYNMITVRSSGLLKDWAVVENFWDRNRSVPPTTLPSKEKTSLSRTLLIITVT